MTNLKIGKNIVSIRAYDVDTGETTTDALLELFGKYADEAALHYLLIDDDISKRANEALWIALDIKDYVESQP